MSLLDPILSSIYARLSRLERAQLTPREGIVTQNMPMMVKLDGDTASTPVRPMVSAGEGTRVLCIKAGLRWYAIASLAIGG